MHNDITLLPIIRGSKTVLPYTIPNIQYCSSDIHNLSCARGPSRDNLVGVLWVCESRHAKSPRTRRLHATLPPTLQRNHPIQHLRAWIKIFSFAQHVLPVIILLGILRVGNIGSTAESNDTTTAISMTLNSGTLSLCTPNKISTASDCKYEPMLTLLLVNCAINFVSVLDV